MESWLVSTDRERPRGEEDFRKVTNKDAESSRGDEKAHEQGANAAPHVQGLMPGVSSSPIQPTQYNFSAAPL